MDTRGNRISSEELVSEVSGLLTGLGVISIALFPFAVPLLALTLVLALPVVLLAIPALALWLCVRSVSWLWRHLPSAAAGRQASGQGFSISLRGSRRQSA